VFILTAACENLCGHFNADGVAATLDDSGGLLKREKTKDSENHSDGNNQADEGVRRLICVAKMASGESLVAEGGCTYGKGLNVAWANIEIAERWCITDVGGMVSASGVKFAVVVAKEVADGLVEFVGESAEPCVGKHISKLNDTLMRFRQVSSRSQATGSTIAFGAVQSDMVFTPNKIPIGRSLKLFSKKVTELCLFKGVTKSTPIPFLFQVIPVD